MSYLTDKDIADRIDKSPGFVQAQCRAHLWPHLRFGRSYRFTEKHAAAIEALCEVQPTTKPAEESWGRAPGRRTS